MKLRIESTETGEVFNMRMESSIDKLKFQVSLLIPIPPHDQIMLIGPPYKILDSLYGPSLNVEGKRIFVFNRRILSDETKEPQRIRLLPYEVMKPDISTDMIKDVDTNQTKSAVMEFENYFQQQLKKSQCIETYVQESFKSCRACVTQHQVQLDGIGAAISNLQYFHTSISKAYTQCESKLTAQQAEHAALLESFETSLQSLAHVPLHPAIKAAFSEYSNSAAAGAGAGGAGGGMSSSVAGGGASSPIPANIAAAQTLYDCVPVERERVYLAQCVANHKKVDENLKRVHSLYEEVQAGVRELTLPAVDFDSLKHHLDNLEQENTAQAEIMRRFRRDYQFVYDHITHCSSPSRQGQGQGQRADSLTGDEPSPHTATATAESPTHHDSNITANMGMAAAGAGGPIDSFLADHSVHSTTSNTTLNTATGTANTANTAATDTSALVAVLPNDDVERVLIDLQRRKHSQEGGHYIELMEFRVKRVRECKNEIEKSQNWLLRSIYRLMRQIALLQTDIQYKLKRDVDWMKKLVQGHNEYFLHLQNITKLPFIYQHTLNEIVRRRSYNVLFEAEIVAASDKIAQFRTQETHQREQYMQLYGLHLPPVFYKAIPTLRDKPPYYSPTLTDPQWLPEIQYDDVDHDYLSREYTAAGSNNANTPKDNENINSGAGGSEKMADTDTVTTDQSDMSGVRAAVPQHKQSDSNLSGTPAAADSKSNMHAMLNRFDSGTSHAAEEGGESGLSNVTNNISALSLSKEAAAAATATANAAAVATAGLNADPTSTENNNMGGSIILRAMPNTSADTTANSEAYNELLQKYRRMEYENSQLVFKVAEMNRKLHVAGHKADKHSSLQQSIDTTLSGPVSNPGTPEAGSTPTHLIRTSNITATNTLPSAAAVATNTNTTNTNANTATNMTATNTASITTNTSAVENRDANTSPFPTPSADISTETTHNTTTASTNTHTNPAQAYTPTSAKHTNTTATAGTVNTPVNSVSTASSSSKSDEELTIKLSRVGVLNQLVNGYSHLHSLLTSDSLIQAYLSELKAHSTIPTLEDQLYTTNETFVSTTGTISSIKDTTQATLQAVHEVLFALSTQLKYPKITFMDFKAGDVALFMPVVTDNRKIWMAFHASTPYRYLAEDSLISFQSRSKNKEQRAHIMGRIILIDTKTASLDENPYNLTIGTEYYICYVEALKSLSKGRQSSTNTTISSANASGTGSNAGTPHATANTPVTSFYTTKPAATTETHTTTNTVTTNPTTTTTTTNNNNNNNSLDAAGSTLNSRNNSNTNLSLQNPTDTTATTTGYLHGDW